jgi:hypothetical protein
MDSKGNIHYLPDDEARLRGLHPVPAHLEKAAEEAWRNHDSLTKSRNVQAARWARKAIIRSKNRRRRKIAKASMKRNRQ